MIMSYIIYKQKSNPIHGVLFDMDGVVLDTEKLYARFWAEAANALAYITSQKDITVEEVPNYHA